ncbi:MAG TPA: peptidyl-prolyl cis-trans isomerase [Smithellaceae bacterium]|nr:peptidyl-prolyl cis-trans isomerase [Smithellaceae bacterium]
MNNMQSQRLKIWIKPGPFLPLVLLAALCLLAACSRENVPHQQVVATVNGEKIYLDEYQKRLNAQKGLLSAQALAESLNKQELLDEEILESMITEKIVLQRARELNLSVSDAELERKILDIRKDYGDNFFNLLTQQNVRYEDWREELRKEMLRDKLVAADVNAQIRVSEDEAEDYFNDHPGLCKSQARVRAAQIVVRDREKADNAKTRLQNGEDFARVAAEVSIAPEAIRGGDLGFIYRESLPDPLDKTLFHLPAGKISPVVKSDYGYHIFKVTDIQPARTRSFPECKEDVMADIRARKEDAAFTRWLDGLKLKAIVKKETHNLSRKKTK